MGSSPASRSVEHVGARDDRGHGASPRRRRLRLVGHVDHQHGAVGAHVGEARGSSSVIDPPDLDRIAGVGVLESRPGGGRARSRPRRNAAGASSGRRRSRTRPSASMVPRRTWCLPAGESTASASGSAQASRARFGRSRRARRRIGRTNISNETRALTGLPGNETTADAAWIAGTPRRARGPAGRPAAWPRARTPTPSGPRASRTTSRAPALTPPTVITRSAVGGVLRRGCAAGRAASSERHGQATTVQPHSRSAWLSSGAVRVVDLAAARARCRARGSRGPSARPAPGCGGAPSTSVRPVRRDHAELRGGRGRCPRRSSDARPARRRCRGGGRTLTDGGRGEGDLRRCSACRRRSGGGCDACSIGTTASAPAGSGAPVMIGAAVPASDAERARLAGR